MIAKIPLNSGWMFAGLILVLLTVADRARRRRRRHQIRHRPDRRCSRFAPLVEFTQREDQGEVPGRAGREAAGNAEAAVEDARIAFDPNQGPDHWGIAAQFGAAANRHAFVPRPKRDGADDSRCPARYPNDSRGKCHGRRGSHRGCAARTRADAELSTAQSAADKTPPGVEKRRRKTNLVCNALAPAFRGAFVEWSLSVGGQEGHNCPSALFCGSDR